jgi:hypothetical protein
MTFAKPNLRAVAWKIDREMIRLGCEAYVKTIYVGYEIGGAMVAALYPHPDHLEIALALDEGFEHSLLEAADHLSWRTLPVSALITEPRNFSEVAPLLHLAVERVVSGSHAVSRDNEFFKMRRGSKRGRMASGRSPKMPKKTKMKRTKTKTKMKRTTKEK